MNEKELNDALVSANKLADRAILAATRAIDQAKKSKNLQDLELTLNLTGYAHKQLMEAIESIQTDLLSKLK